MSDISIRPYAPEDLEGWRALLAEPSIAPQFDAFQGPHGLEQKLGDSHLAHDTIHLAFANGAPVGFGFSFLLGGSAGPWAMMRVAVLPAWRRKGIGRRLAGAVMEAVDRHGRLEKLSSAWLAPEGEDRNSDAAEPFAAALGFVHERWFWLMERPRGAASPAPVWPADVTIRVFDRSEAMLGDWNDAYNGSFIDHWRFVPSSLEDVRQFAASPDFPVEGLLVAYRGGAAAGFCRCEIYANRGEVGALGTVRGARGIGLGRALLRWGVAWLEANTTTPVTLVVDGQNEGALALYRSEGFAITRTRRVWKLPAA